MLRKITVLLLALLVTAGAFGSGQNQSSSGGSGQITIKVFTNLPDRWNGQGLVEQIIFDQYMKENPNIKIEVEALDDEAYKVKFKAYAAGNSMPDLVSTWGQPGFINEVIAAGILAELNQADYSSYGFLPGSLDGWIQNGKLYGLPRNTDVMGFYYNEKIFRDNGWAVPKTFDELIALGNAIKAKGLIPVAMDGGDKWPLGLFLHNLIAKLNGPGTNAIEVQAINTNWNAPIFSQAAKLLQDAAKGGLFQNGFENTDYGTAQNMFTSGQAAMYFMGSWDMSMANNKDYSQEFRDNLRVFTMPVVSGGKGAATDIAAWNGGGHSVSAKGANKAEAIKLLNYMYKSENWTRLAWVNGVCMSAQNFSQYQTGTETPVQKQFIEVVAAATSLSGTPYNDSGTSEFKTRGEDLVQQLAISKITVADFIAKMD